jgi:hypothetical protein
MQVFKRGDIIIVCESKSTRNGFKHVATLTIGGYEHAKATCQYLNRTWESYQFCSVIQEVLAKADRLTPRQVKGFLKKYQNSY